MLVVLILCEEDGALGPGAEKFFIDTSMSGHSMEGHPHHCVSVELLCPIMQR